MSPASAGWCKNQLVRKSIPMKRESTPPLSPLTLWREKRLGEIHAGRGLSDYDRGRDDVTALLYFWANNPQETDFRPFECALRETWLQCGMLPTTIVTNQPFPFLRRFSELFAPFVRIDLVPELVPGDLSTMSADMNGHLADHFDTPWVLVVQEDGFPLRKGLDEFVGKWDFIGAPWNGEDDWITRRLLLTENLVGNGGFSLRSRAICLGAAHHWSAIWRHLPRCYLMQEDIFYARFLPRWSRSYRERSRFAPIDVASRFSTERTHPAINAPFGFHSAEAFARIVSSYDGAVSFNP